MAIQLAAVSVTAPNQLTLSFSDAVLSSAALFDPSNYAFRTRFGADVPLYSQAVQKTDAYDVVVTLRDAMLQGGHYLVSVNGILGADGDPIDTAANSLPFEGVGLPQWVFTLKRHAPSWWIKRYGSLFGSLLEATGIELDTLAGVDNAASAYATAQQALSLRTATGSDLAVIASNYGVRRPDFAASDTLFRKLIPLLATQRKSVLKIFYDVLTVLVGPQASSGWQVYEVLPNRLVIEIPSTLLRGFGAATQGSATYLHADATVSSDGTYPGDYLLPDASHSDTEVGQNSVIVYTGVNNIVDVINQIKAAGIEYSIYAP